ncbi:hypothetical protein [Flavobacterium sp.]|uniref:hypothetical protein n=1 Tax=Flavobacterium sp. TaxID=239 RepID=UPI003BD2B2E1
MKNLLLLFAISSVFTSCKLNNSTEGKTKEQTKDSTIVGVDKDTNGCLASAGYTWSKLNKECVKAFSGIQLIPTENTTTVDETLCAYVLFNENADKAEIFLPDDKSFIFTKNNQRKTWSYSDYQLIAHNGYELKKAGVIVYFGDSEIGNKESGSSDSDVQE